MRERFGCPVLTDVHGPEQCAPAAEAVDVLQIPAFLCRQTDLLLAAGETGRAINVKKGQFLAPWDMANVAAKIAGTGNESILLCRARRQLRLQHAGHRLPRPADHGAHRLPGGVRRHPFGAAARRPGHDLRRPARVRAGAGARRSRRSGVAALFIETHPDPDRAPSDGPNMIALREMPALVARLKQMTSWPSTADPVGEQFTGQRRRAV